MIVSTCKKSQKKKKKQIGVLLNEFAMKTTVCFEILINIFGII